MTTTERVAVVTGAASGMGLAIARTLASRGDRVALLDRQGDAVLRAAEGLRESGARTLGAEVDVTDRAAIDVALGKVRAELGPIGIVVTAAGIDRFEPFTEITSESWERVLAVNLTGTFHCLQAAVPDMLAARWGRMVTISSSSAQSGSAHLAHYVAAKAGVIGLTRALAVELARHGITVNCIPPGMIDTPMLRGAEGGGDIAKLEKLAARMIPVGRIGTPEEVAATCAFLCSDEAAFITGQVIGVNGGMVL
ncbi:MAG TPA: SDR family NAD(P)-dependent oxidoreductase [Candidatus Eisenbacteria bacterium]|nr:SDR family NAD(P)-dependent oxidoreductase [Candidatus Eisenbacteria bacterium]